MIHTGDCVAVMRTLPDASVDAVVTDPPYGLEFMGKEWDRLGAGTLTDPSVVGGFQDGNGGNAFSRSRVRFGTDARTMQAWHEQWATEAFRVLKPGGYLLAFGGTRTVHRLASAIEDAGFEIRDELVWIYASGFPKSLDVSKALDKSAGAEREQGGTSGTNCSDFPEPCSGHVGNGRYSPTVHALPTLPATDLARQWQGWGTALKPAHEPIVMARKPLVGTVAQNVTRYGTGALNIDGSRIPSDRQDTRHGGSERTDGWGMDPEAKGYDLPAGRWPSNVLLSDPELFDQPNPYVVGSGATAGDNGGGFYTQPEQGEFEGASFGDFLNAAGKQPFHYGDSGGYSRFFIIPKADRAEREPVLRGRALRMSKQRENSHPTVKPVDLMRHLVRLVTPPGGTVLDPFLGSGTTAIACELEGFPWIGIEKDADYVAIAEARLNGTQRGLGLDVPAPQVARGPTLNGVALTVDAPIIDADMVPMFNDDDVA